MIALLSILMLVVQAPAAVRPIVAGRLAVSKPSPVVEISGDRARGFPVRLSWSPDGQMLYLRTVERDIWANEKDRHFLVGVADGGIRAVEAEPAWSTQYWAWKSGFNCPGAPALKIETESRTERKSATGAGAGGSLAQNSGDPYGPGFELGPQGAAIVAGAMQSQTVTTTTMKLKGRVLSEFVNTHAILGLMYGWAPEGSEAIAYASEKRVLVVMDGTGARHEVRGTKGVLLPAWSESGRRLAWLSQQGRRKFVLMIADVTAAG
jgi:hypothetical protein